MNSNPEMCSRKIVRVYLQKKNIRFSIHSASYSVCVFVSEQIYLFIFCVDFAFWKNLIELKSVKSKSKS